MAKQKKELKARNMITLRRLGIYLIAWILLVIITALFSAEGLYAPATKSYRHIRLDTQEYFLTHLSFLVAQTTQENRG